MVAKKTDRCIACGKELVVGEKVMQIIVGKTSDDGSLASSKEFGRIHESCFERSVASPSVTMAKIRKAAKETILISPPKKTA